MTVEDKPVVTKKPGWLGGVILPALAGIPLGVVLSGYASVSFYVLAAFQLLFAAALVFERAAVYGAATVPQAQRLCALYFLSWLAMTVVTLVTIRETSKSATQMLAVNLVWTFGFSVAAGPAGLVDANDSEMILVPMNSLVVGWASTSLYFLTTAAE